MSQGNIQISHLMQEQSKAFIQAQVAHGAGT